MPDKNWRFGDVVRLNQARKGKRFLVLFIGRAEATERSTFQGIVLKDELSPLLMSDEGKIESYTDVYYNLHDDA